MLRHWLDPYSLFPIQGNSILFKLSLEGFCALREELIDVVSFFCGPLLKFEQSSLLMCLELLNLFLNNGFTLSFQLCCKVIENADFEILLESPQVLHLCQVIFEWGLLLVTPFIEVFYSFSKTLREGISQFLVRDILDKFVNLTTFTVNDRHLIF